MSENFSIVLWVANLPFGVSCIQDEGASGRLTNYYALAEDIKGKHYPYPKLPMWAQGLFEIRSGLGKLFGRPCPVRGVDWGFSCPECGGEQFFKMSDDDCENCGMVYDADMVAQGRPEFYYYNPRCHTPATGLVHRRLRLQRSGREQRGSELDTFLGIIWQRREHDDYPAGPGKASGGNHEGLRGLPL